VFGVGTLCLLLFHDGIERGNGLESLVIIGLIQAALLERRLIALGRSAGRGCLSDDGHESGFALKGVLSVVCGRDRFGFVRGGS
jgi:hypothetical protein